MTVAATAFMVTLPATPKLFPVITISEPICPLFAEVEVITGLRGAGLRAMLIIALVVFVA